MVGCELRTSFAMLTEDQKHKIKYLCKKHGITPECRYSGGDIENMSFDFGDDIEGQEAFVKDMEEIMNVTSHGVKRRVFGHRIDCPL